MASPSIHILANWKAYFTYDEVQSWMAAFAEIYSPYENVQVLLGPSFTSIPYVIDSLTFDDVMVYAQDVSQYEPGKHTGEITVEDLLSQMIDSVLIGHSERRLGNGEHVKIINQKIKRVLDTDLTLYVAVSEIEQCKAVIDDNVDPSTIVWAYEPLDAIGSGKPADPERVEQFVKDMYDVAGKPITVIYGGSVDSNNIDEFLSIDEIQGALIASASKDPEEFIKIIEIASTK